MENKGCLVFVATPIGNLNDISNRAIQELSSADLILCEDTRHSLKLLNSLEIKKPLMSFHKFNYKEATPTVINKLLEGQKICLITDAGTPCISDPGSELLPSLKEHNIPYTIIPGACAFVNAFALSGFKTPCTFVGFLPDNKKQKRELLEELKTYKSTLIFYSAPHALKEDVKTLFSVLGNRKAVAVRELTKIYEEVVEFELESGYPKEAKGEFVIVVEGFTPNETAEESVEELFNKYTSLGYDKNEAIKMIAKEKNVAKNIIYKQILQLNESSK